jgi:RNA polymerase sigma-70 factor (ECF subfamily)
MPNSFPEPAMPEVLIGPNESAEATAVYADWSDLVARIRSGETDGMEELYHLFSRGIRFYLANQLGTIELDDRVHDTFVVIVQAIRRGELRDPERLMGFVRTIVRRQVAAHIDQGVDKRATQSVIPVGLPRENPAEVVAFHRRTELIDRVLTTLSGRDREILTRFYLLEQSQDEICSEMGLTESQFRLMKSRAKARFQELGRKKLRRDWEPPLHLFDAPRSLDAGGAEVGSSHPLGGGRIDVVRILPIVAHAVAVFGDEQKASHWMATPLPLFGNRSPSQLLEEGEGIKLVEQVLTRIEHNIPS